MSTPASPSGFAPARVVPNLRHAFGGIFRLTLRRMMLPTHWLTLLGLCGLLVLLALPVVHREAQARREFLPWMVGFYLTFLVPIMSFITAGGAIRDEMKAGNVDYVFTRPVPRPAFVGFKFLSYLACVQLDFLLAFATVIGVWVGVGLPQMVPDFWPHAWALLGAQILVVTAFSAFGFMCGVVTSRYIVVGLAYGAIIEVGVGQIPTQISKLSMTHQVQGMLQGVLGGGQNIFGPNSSLVTTSVGTTIALLLGFTAIMLFLAASILAFMELSGPNEA
jgi:ABC-type transport system involved in multi-copper enzyme maturation permease subunit